MSTKKHTRRDWSIVKSRRPEDRGTPWTLRADPLPADGNPAHFAGDSRWSSQNAALLALGIAQKLDNGKSVSDAEIAGAA